VRSCLIQKHRLLVKFRVFGIYTGEMLDQLFVRIPVNVIVWLVVVKLSPLKTHQTNTSNKQIKQTQTTTTNILNTQNTHTPSMWVYMLFFRSIISRVFFWKTL